MADYLGPPGQLEYALLDARLVQQFHGGVINASSSNDHLPLHCTTNATLQPPPPPPQQVMLSCHNHQVHLLLCSACIQLCLTQSKRLCSPTKGPP